MFFFLFVFYLLDPFVFSVGLSIGMHDLFLRESSLGRTKQYFLWKYILGMHSIETLGYINPRN